MYLTEIDSDQFKLHAVDDINGCRVNMCTERPSMKQCMNWMYVHVKDTVNEGKQGRTRGEQKRQRQTQRLTFFMI